MKKPFRAILIGLVVLLVVSNFILIWQLQVSRKKSRATDSGTQALQYPFLSKRIFIDSQNDMLLNFVPLRKQINADFDALPSGTQHSFYFEYLPSGTSIRNGSDNTLVAASLIKVPLVMNLYKAVELGKISLDKEVTISQSELDAGYGTLYQKGAGTRITLGEAAKLALVQSDNTATHVIFDNTKGLLTSDQESLNNLDIDQGMKDGQAVIDAKSYTSVLKSLFLASYVNRDSSQAILSYLTQSTATNRLTAQLPSDVKVAHKIGVNAASWSESDCGIVYVPKRPYALCAMVGLDEAEANDFIAKLSKQVYDYVVSQ